MRRQYTQFSLASILILMMLGCGGGAAPPAPKPITASLSASPSTITAGAKAALSWSTANATTVSINQGIGTVAASGSMSVSPTATTTYTLTASNGTNTVTSTATVTVTAAPAITATLTASPASISSGQSTTLTWSTANATTVSINQGIGTVAASGSMSVAPTATTTYTLTATGVGQPATSAATVTVTGTGALPTAHLTASPATIQVLSGQSATLTWSTANATSVSIDNGIGTVAASGTQTVSPMATTTYTLTATGGGQPATSTATVTVTPLTGVMEWKGSVTGNGLYDNETTLTPANVNVTQFGKVRRLIADGELLAQPLYVRNVDLGATGVHNLLIVATENDSIYAFDGQGTSTTPLWQRSFISPASCTTNCITTQPDDHGGRSTFGGEVGITGTPVIDPLTGTLYVVAATEQNGTITDTLHALDIRTGNDAAGAGSVVIAASVPGTGEDSVNGVLTFNATYENQRPGLVLSNGVLYIAFGSFSDVPPFHGWLLAYDPATLQAIFNTTPTYTANDPNYEEGVGAGFWASGASPTIAADGTIYIVGANGSTDVQNGGMDYGDTVLHLSFDDGEFKVLDWFTPSNRDCTDLADLEIGSGGVVLLPPEVGGSNSLAVTTNKEGRLYLLDQDNLGHFNATKDQVPQEFMVGADTCTASTTAIAAADGTTWQRLYGNPSYWNGNLYMVPANTPIHQYSIANGVINPTPVAVGATATYVRGGNTIVSSNGNSDGIVWMYEKTSAGDAILHAYDATKVSKELWNSQMNATRDGLNTGDEGFQVPVVVDGNVIAPSGTYLDVYSLLP